MQTRKRAKSITFGKPKKEADVSAAEKEEKKVVAPEPEPTAKKAPEVIEPKVEKPTEEKNPEITEAAKKVLALEESMDETPEEKPKEDELSDTPEILKGPETVTPADEFVTDPTSSSTIEPVQPPAEDEEKTIASDNLSEPVVEPTATPKAKEEKPEEEPSSDLSPTPPASAFTIAGNDIDASQNESGKKKNFVLYFIVVALISFVLGLAAMAAVTYFGLVKLPLTAIPGAQELVKRVNPTQPTPTTAAPSVAPTDVPTEKPLDLKAYTVSVLNGSGIKGKAAEVKTSLTTAGFTVGTTGNADRSDYTTTQIAAKKKVDKAYLEKLTAELKKSYKVEPVSTIPSDSSQTADVIVTLGSE